MKRIFDVTTDQQAPSTAWHSLLDENQRLSTKAHLRKGIRVYHKMTRASSVSAELSRVLKRLARAQPKTPTLAGGGLTPDLRTLSTAEVSGIDSHPSINRQNAFT
jgi:hypothetical protein